MRMNPVTLWCWCFNVSVDVLTRVTLIVLTDVLYHSFVLAEILLNNSSFLYPEWISRAFGRLGDDADKVTLVIFNVIASKVVMLNGFMRRCLRFLVSLLAIFVHPITHVVNIKRNRKCPPPTNPILYKSATTLAMMIRTKQITSEEVVKSYIERCKEVNPYLNAIVEPRYDLALREAKCIDKMIASNDRSPDDLAREHPLLGVPLTVKESIAVEGMSNDCGTIRHKREPAARDADVVRAARAAGAVIIAVTNTPQLCMNWETYNNVTGLTMNPYDQRLTTGGSSGGESALISSAASVIGMGSDIAGSLRLPPMFNGIFGHKPTPKLISIQGHVPDCLESEFEEYFALGPITRYAEDLSLMLKILRQPNGPDVPLDKPVDLTRLRFYYMEGDCSNVTDNIGSDMKKALYKAKDYIKSTYNVEVEELKIPNIEHMWEISVRVLLKVNHVQNIYTDPQKRDQWVSVWPEVLKKMVGMSDHSFTSVVYGPVKKFFDALPDSYYEKLLKVFEQIKSDFSAALSDDAVLLFPTYPYPAHKHYRIFYRFLNCGYLTIFNVLGLPATACPLGLSDKGLPVGIQVVANKCNDHLTLAVAKEFEKAFGGWSPPNKDLLNSVKTA